VSGEIESAGSPKDATPARQARQQVLRGRAEQLAHKIENAEQHTGLELICFRLASEDYAIEARFVREVCPLKALTPIPPALRYGFSIGGSLFPPVAPSGSSGSVFLPASPPHPKVDTPRPSNNIVQSLFALMIVSSSAKRMGTLARTPETGIVHDALPVDAITRDSNPSRSRIHPSRSATSLACH